MKKILRNVLPLVALMALPWAINAQALNEGFEGTTFPPDNWTAVHVSGSNQWARSTSSGGQNSTAFAYRQDVNGGYNDYLITPLLAPASGDSLSFWLASQYSYNYAGTTLTIEVSTTLPAPSAFTTVLATYTSGSSGTFGTSGATNWVNKKVDLSAYDGQQIYIAFHVVDNGYDADVRIDNVTGTSVVVPTCRKVTGLTAAAADSASITLSWIDTASSNNGATYSVAYWSNAGDTTWETAYDTFLVVTDLAASTAYHFMVRALCSSTDSSMAVMGTFRTTCGDITIPWGTSFEDDAASSAPSCWTVLSSYAYQDYDYSTYSYVTANYPAVSTGAHTGSKSLGFITENTPNMIASSRLAANNESLVVSFWAQTDAYYGSAPLVLQAGLMTNLADTSTFTPMVTLTGDNDYASHEFVTPMLSSDSTYYLAFRYTCNYEYAYADVDDISIRANDGCLRPTNVVALGIDTATITLSWADSGTVNDYAVRYRVKGTTTWNTLDGITTMTTDVIGLETATHYELMVGTVCTNDTLWTATVEAKTTCGIMSLPYINGFENDVVGEMPACWNQSGATGTPYYGTGTYPSVYGYGAHAGQNDLYFDYINGTSIVSTEAVPLDGDSIHVIFWAKIEGGAFTTAPTLAAGVMTNPAVESTFFPLISVSGSDWQRYEFTTATLAHDSTYYVAFRYISTSTYNTAAIDDIEIRKDEGCHYPGVITTTATANSIVLSWTSTSYVNNYVVQYRPSGGTWSTPQEPDALSDTLTGLNSSTMYEIRVGNVCGSDTLWAFASEQTLCGYQAVPYFENFDSYATDVMPPCWSFAIPDGITHDDGGCFFRSNRGGGANYAVLPALDGAISKLKIEFDVKTGTIAENDGLLIGVADINGTLLGWLDTLQDPDFSRNEFVHQTIYFPNYEMPIGAARVAFAQYRNWGEWALIDNIAIEVLPNCYPVDNVTGHNLIDPEATYFTWSPVGTEAEWQVYVDTVTVDIDALATIPVANFDTVSSTSYTIPMNRIQGGGLYNFFVRALCADEQSTWVKKEFGAGTVIMQNNTVADTVDGCGFVVYDNGGPVAGYLANSNSTYVLRSVNAGTQLQVFGAKFGIGSSGATLTVYDGVGTSGTALYTYNTANGRDTLSSVLATSTTGALTITFVSYGSMCHTGYELYVRCTGNATCPRPTELQSELTSATAAHVTWNGTAPNYNFYYRLGGTTSWTHQQVNTNSITLTGLMTDTVYDMYVVALCSATDSSTASVIRHLSTHTGTTPQSGCDPVTNVTVSGITATGATISWTAPAGQSRWEVAFGGTTAETTNNPYTLTGLTPSTNYTVKVRALCDNETTSEWSSEEHFTTLASGSEGIDEVADSRISLYPNPASSTVTLDLSGVEGAVKVTVIDANGRTVATRSFASAEPSHTFDLAGMAKGAYFVRVTGSNISTVRKLIIK